MGILPNMRNWRLINAATFEEVEGDFEAVNLTLDSGATYADSFALNSDLPITQWLHGNVDTISFTVRLFDDSIAPQAVLTNMKFVLVQEKLEKLLEWVKKDESTGRPPALLFSAGNGEVSLFCTIGSLIGVRYDPLTWTGAVRGVTFTLNLRRFVPHDTGAAATSPPETRYHRVKTGDYYELIAQREYGKPMIGDIIRYRHPSQHKLTEAETVKLPSFAAIQREKLAPRSLQLQGLNVGKASAQRTLRQQYLDRLNRGHISHQIPSGW